MSDTAHEIDAHARWAAEALDVWADQEDDRAIRSESEVYVAWHRSRELAYRDAAERLRRIANSPTPPNPEEGET